MLEGIRVIEMATYVAAPAAGGLLADWGAEVIKVEPPRGCPMRAFLSNMQIDHAGPNPLFDLDNRGKRGAVLDITQEEGADAVRRLAAGADVFLTNVRPEALKRAGLDYNTLAAAAPRLVYASVTGYGLQGAEHNRPGFDIAAFYARSGFGHLFTPKDQEPVQLRTAVGDHVTGVGVVAGILAALMERERTGKGRLVEASLLRAGIYALGSDLSIFMHMGRNASTKPRHQVGDPLANYYRSRDGVWVVLVPRQGSHDWRAICRLIGRPELPDEPRYATSRDRKRCAAEIVDLLDAAFGELDLAELGARLDAEDLVWAPMQSPAQVLADPQAQAAGAFVDVPAPGGGVHRSLAGPIRFPGADDGPRRPVPALGEHTDAVLREAGYDAAAIARLRDRGAAGPAAAATAVKPA